MLDKQYRFHGDIMKIVNEFYGGEANGLKLGKPNQNFEKDHGLTVKIGNNTIVDPDKHIYFVDCDEKESGGDAGSKSLQNEQEANAVIKMLSELNKSVGDLITLGKIKADKKPSVGVICTYGLQTGLIKKRIKNNKIKYENFSRKSDEQLIISTVDEFQGDERDIILVSMVRNPRNPRNFNAEFVKKYERINVAFSRARNMLMIFGSKRFLSDQWVELPDASGDDTQSRPVYRNIVTTVELYGRVISANDILPAEPKKSGDNK